MASQQNYTILIFLCISIVLSNGGQSDAATLPDNEIEVLKIIQTLGKGDWDLSRDPCGFDELICNCSDVNSTVCHVTNITLGSQNLTGVLPPELGNLTRLEELDLADNYLNGSIPPQLGSLDFLKLLNLSRNLLSGPVPKEIGNLSKLVILKIHTNKLSGVIPKEIWNLTMLDKLDLSSNQFTGEIFPTEVILHNLTEFRASSNNFNGTIPSFIGNFSKLRTLILQGTLLEGPIPPNISILYDLVDLRISDILHGKNSSLDFISNLMNLRTLVLRNNFITAEIPDGLGKLRKLRTLDLSFNNLSGPIPGSLGSLELEFLFLGNNSLTGTLPTWLTTSKATIDLSYNNLSGDIKSDLLDNKKVNLIWNSLKPADKRNWMGCLQRNFPCGNRATNYGMAINCGGTKLKISAKSFIFNEFEDDTYQDAPLVYQNPRWGVTNVGSFIDNENSTTQYIVRGDPSFTPDMHNSSVDISNIDEELYKTARVSPMSLRYYALDLQPGPYSIELHFVEIQFPNNKTSKGVRIFDVYIQRDRVLKDFNIRETAGNKNLVVFNYTRNVTQKFLEIHFFWAGKGTCCEPQTGTYGPLISAIAVVPLFKPDIPKKSKTVMIVIIVVVLIVILALLLVLSIIFNKKRKKGEKICSCLREDKEMKTIDGNYFSLGIMKLATKNFDPKRKIGEGGFGVVYKGVLPDGRKVAIKKLSSQSKQGNREFLNEVGTISAVQHPYLVKLYGCCVEEELLLVYEYLENGNLAQALFGRDESRVKLDWPTRYRICVGVARGLAHLHEESQLKIVHRDIKSTNILLDKDLNPKVADFGLARLFDEENTHVSTRVAGTIGYMAPEYALKGHLTDKADVYSFGVVVLEIVSGRTHTDTSLEEERAYLLEWVWQLYEENNMLKLVDMYLLNSGYNEEELERMIYVGLLCTHENPSRRPSMSAVVDMLEGRMGTPNPRSRPGSLNHWQIWQLAGSVHHQQTQSSTSKSSAQQGPWKESSSNSKEDSHSL